MGDLLSLIFEQWLGNALYEELVYRGFLLVQLAVLFSGQETPSRNHWVVAAVVSQLAFALMHLPHRLQATADAKYLLINVSLLFVCGLLYAILYCRTGNLLLVIGLHGLFNVPIPIVDTHIDILEVIWGGLALTLVLIWPRLPKVNRPKQTMDSQTS